MTTPEQRLANHGLTLPAISRARGTYRQWKRTGTLIFLTGKGPRAEDGAVRSGKLGGAVSVEEGYADARMAGLHLLSVLKEAVGELSHVRSVVKVLGMVNAVPEFTQHTAVINGCSDLFIMTFGDEVGNHARSAVGMGSLHGMSVEIEAVVEVEG